MPKIINAIFLTISLNINTVLLNNIGVFPYFDVTLYIKFFLDIVYQEIYVHFNVILVTICYSLKKKSYTL